MASDSGPVFPHIPCSPEEEEEMEEEEEEEEEEERGRSPIISRVRLTSRPNSPAPFPSRSCRSAWPVLAAYKSDLRGEYTRDTREGERKGRNARGTEVGAAVFTVKARIEWVLPP